MILYDNPVSPFCRKVLVLAHETGQMDGIETAAAVGSPIDSTQMPVDHNPLGKIPTLVLSDGSTLYDSRVICRYLDDQSGGAFYPKDTLYQTLRREALADGVMDAAVLMVYEFRARPEGERSSAMVEAMWAKVTRALDQFEAEGVATGFDMSHIALACALGYLNFRQPDRDWATSRPKLATWFAEVSTRSSLAKTAPA